VGFEYNLLITQALVLPPNERGFQNKSIFLCIAGWVQKRHIGGTKYL